MKLEANRRNVETSGVLETNRFTIEMNSAAVDILSSKIYTNTYLAIVRELACNAWDAHVAAKTEDTPFLVTFPSALRSEFRVRDYGTGLSHDNVMYLYTTYFGSDKRDTNDAIGGLGLGSKAPFAYTDAFSVRSYYDGMVRSYAIYRDAEGFPRCDLVDSAETDEHPGLEVQVPVKPADRGRFADQVKALKWFPTTPRIIGAEIKETVWALKAKHGGIRETDSYGNSKVLMGSVLYDLDRSQVEKDEDWCHNNKVANTLLRSTGFTLFAEIGDLSIAASREDLNYTKNTIRRLRVLFELAAEEIMELIEKELEDEKRIAVRYFERNKLPKAMQGVITAANQIEIPDAISLRLVDASSWARKSGFVSAIEAENVTLRQKDHPILIINDVKRAPYRQIMQQNEELKPSKINSHGWSRKYTSVNQDVFVLTISDEDDPEVIAFLKEFDPDQIFRISDYYTPPAKGGANRIGGNVPRNTTPIKQIKRQLETSKILDTNKDAYGWNSTMMSLAELDPAEHILVGVKGKQLHNFEKNYNISYQTVQLANFLNDGEKTFVLIPRQIQKTAFKMKIPNLQTWLDKKIDEFVKNLTREEYAFTMHAAHVEEKTPRLQRYMQHNKTWEHYAPDSLATYLCEVAEAKIGHSSLKTEAIREIENILGKKLFDTTTDTVDECLDQLLGIEDWLEYTYPELTKYLMQSRYRSLDEMTAAYINLKEGIIE